MPGAINQDDVPLAQWYYEQGEWARFVENDWRTFSLRFKRTVKVTASRLYFTTAVFSVLALIVGGWLSALFIFSCFGIMIGAILGGFAATKLVAERNWHNRLWMVKPEITITRDWVFFGDPADERKLLYRRLRGTGRSVTAGVQSTGEAAVLLIEVAGSFGPYYAEVIRIPIPGGHEDEARRVAASIC